MNAARIMDRLEKAALAEPQIWYREDYRQALIVVSLADRGEPQPFVASSYRVHGMHPDKVFGKIMHNRRMKLGKEFGQWFTDDGVLLPDIGVPKKPAIYIDEQAERATNERLAALLVFPKTAVQFANEEQLQKKGKLYEMPSATRIAARQSLRILPVEAAL